MKTLVIGGARSGKSQFCVEQLKASYSMPCLVVTAEPGDEEMAFRIKKHKQSRPKEWLVIEEPLELPHCLRNLPEELDVVLVDCLTLWLSNLLTRFGGSKTEEYIEELVSSVTDFKKALYLVSNEVGLGIVPDNQISRLFRDLSGLLHQKLALVCDSVLFVVAGIPLRVK